MRRLGLFGDAGKGICVRHMMKWGLYLCIGVGLGLGVGFASDATASKSRDTPVVLLARLIHAAAWEEPYAGKVAMGAVVLNRVRSPAFPNTIAGVIFQPGAFLMTQNHRFVQDVPDICLQAARDALNGFDPTGGAVYVWNPQTHTTQWTLGIPETAAIGSHVFGIAGGR